MRERVVLVLTAHDAGPRRLTPADVPACRRLGIQFASLLEAAHDLPSLDPDGEVAELERIIQLES